MTQLSPNEYASECRDFRRRDIVTAGLAACCLPLLPRQAFSQIGTSSAQRFVDIHCHFFNAADLPIRGFVQIVVLEDYEQVQALPEKGLGLEIFSVWKGLAATLTAFLVKRGAPSPADEITCLTGEAACAGFDAAGDKSAADGEKVTDASDKPARQALREVLTEHYDAAGADGADKIARGEERDVDDFLDFVLNEMLEGDKSQITSRDIREDKADKLFIIDDVVAFLLAGRSAFSRYFDWAQLLTSYRTAIARQYRRLYDSSRFKLALVTPALVDFDLWLNDNKHAALKQQAEVMSIISAKSDFPLHPFAPFDPLRDIQKGGDAGSSLALVQTAIREQGFVGVKLYSPMGFRPRGNGLRPITFPEHLGRLDAGFGDRLDAALNALFAWCQSEDVPIMAHTLNSQESNPGFALRADPKFWSDVLTEFPDLRLNLAHFGNFSFAFSAGGAPEVNFGKSWEFEIGQFVSSGRFPNVFADISYFGFVLGPDAERPSAMESAKRLFSLYISKFDPDVKSLMFGTDWSMIARAAHFEQYLTNVDSFFRGVGLSTDQIDNIFYGNAIRFLGLNQNGKVRQRLQIFYQKSGRTIPSL